MTQESPDQNPYDPPTSSDSSYPRGSKAESADLTTVDWLLCIFCSGIACIVGIVRLIQGKPSAGKMIGVSLLFSFLWGILRVIITEAMQNQ